MKEHIQAVFDKSQQRFGANKIVADVTERGVRTSPKYVAELMRKMGLQSVSVYSKRDHQKRQRLLKKQNLLQWQFKADEPNRVWVSDITCFKVDGKYLYVCLILDLFSQKVDAHRGSVQERLSNPFPSQDVPTVPSTTRRRMGLNCAMRREKIWQVNLDMGFKTGCFPFFDR